MRPFFKNPSNTRTTGVVFLKSIIYKEVLPRAIASDNSIIYLIKRFLFGKDHNKLIFLPLSWRCFFGKKGDLIILPDDSLRSIGSVTKVRFLTRSYLKGLYQAYRFIGTYLLIKSLRRCTLYTVSLDDLKTLKDRFPKINVCYLPHPIQSQYNDEVVFDVPSRILKIGFINLQEHYSLRPNSFLVKKTKLDGINIVFHGGYSKYWFDYAKKIGFESNVTYEEYIDDFEGFYNDIDVVVMPLVAGAGIKNILLNSVYRNKYVFGTKEAFSGIPTMLSHPFIVCDTKSLTIKIDNISNLRMDFDKLRAYILEHHSISAFKKSLNGVD